MLLHNIALSLVPAVSCALPSSPANGSIEAYNSTQVGTEIQFHCDEGFIPTEWRTAQCQQNGTWTPEPTLLNCSVGMHFKNTTDARCSDAAHINMMSQHINFSMLSRYNYTTCCIVLRA